MTSIKGEVAPGFEPVRDVFARAFEFDRETGASFAVFKDGRYLVDIWGGHADAAQTRPWQRNTLPNVWSTTKAVAALCVALLVERGLLAYEDKVARHWPEFAAEGKGDITVGQLMSHQAGLCGLRETTTIEDFYDQDVMAERLAAQAPLWEPGTKSGYHAITYGFLSAELVRRVTGKSIGTFFREEIAEPWDIDFFIGLPENEEHRIAEMIEAPKAPRKKNENRRAPGDIQKLTFLNPLFGQAVPNDRAWRAAEIASANGRGSAAALARLLGAIAEGGTLGGVPLFSEKTIEKLRQPQIRNRDLILGFEMTWAPGVILNETGILYGPNKSTIGHSGWGGSFALADPETGLGISYVMNRMGTDLAADPRAMALLGATYEALAEAA